MWTLYIFTHCPYSSVRSWPHFQLHEWVLVGSGQSAFPNLLSVVIYVRSVSVIQDIQLGETGPLFPPFRHEQKSCYPDCVWQTFYEPLLREIQHRGWQKKAESGTLMTFLRCPISGSSWCESVNSLYHLRQFQLGFLILACRDIVHWETIKWFYVREWFALVPFFKKKGYPRLRKQIYWLTKEKLDQEESFRSDCSCLCERL